MHIGIGFGIDRVRPVALARPIIATSLPQLGPLTEGEAAQDAFTTGVYALAGGGAATVESTTPYIVGTEEDEATTMVAALSGDDQVYVEQVVSDGGSTERTFRTSPLITVSFATPATLDNPLPDLPVAAGTRVIVDLVPVWSRSSPTGVYAVVSGLSSYTLIGGVLDFVANGETVVVSYTDSGGTADTDSFTTETPIPAWTTLPALTLDTQDATTATFDVTFGVPTYGDLSHTLTLDGISVIGAISGGQIVVTKTGAEQLLVLTGSVDYGGAGPLVHQVGREIAAEAESDFLITDFPDAPGEKRVDFTWTEYDIVWNLNGPTAEEDVTNFTLGVAELALGPVEFIPMRFELETDDAPGAFVRIVDPDFYHTGPLTNRTSDLLLGGVSLGNDTKRFAYPNNNALLTVLFHIEDDNGAFDFEYEVDPQVDIPVVTPDLTDEEFTVLVDGVFEYNVLSIDDPAQLIGLTVTDVDDGGGTIDEWSSSGLVIYALPASADTIVLTVDVLHPTGGTASKTVTLNVIEGVLWAGELLKVADGGVAIASADANLYVQSFGGTPTVYALQNSPDNAETGTFTVVWDGPTASGDIITRFRDDVDGINSSITFKVNGVTEEAIDFPSLANAFFNHTTSDVALEAGDVLTWTMDAERDGAGDPCFTAVESISSTGYIAWDEVPSRVGSGAVTAGDDVTLDVGDPGTFTPTYTLTLNGGADLWGDAVDNMDGTYTYTTVTDGTLEFAWELEAGAEAGSVQVTVNPLVTYDDFGEPVGNAKVTSGSTTVTLNATPTAGQIILLWSCKRDTNGTETISWPASFTQVGIAFGDSSVNTSIGLAWKVSDGTETSLTATYSAGSGNVSTGYAVMDNDGGELSILDDLIVPVTGDGTVDVNCNTGDAMPAHKWFAVSHYARSTWGVVGQTGDGTFVAGPGTAASNTPAIYILEHDMPTGGASNSTIFDNDGTANRPMPAIGVLVRGVEP